MNEIQQILFGKNPMDRIVSIEPNEHSIEVFRELSDGTVTSEFLPNDYWILADRPLESDRSWVRLQGELHYKWGKQYQTRDEFLAAKRRFYNRNAFSIYNPKEAAMVKDGLGNFINMKIDDVSVLSFDIETTTLNPRDKNSLVILIANTFRRKGKVERKLFCHDDYVNQGQMLTAWVEWVRQCDPSIILGHNIFGFDLEYLQVIADQNEVSLGLGRDKSNLVRESYERKFRVDGSRDLHYHNFMIYGRELIDTMFLAIKADIKRQYNSYGLKPIIAQEGWEVEGRVFYDASKIRFNYKDPIELKKIKEYAIFDADDSLTLYDKFIPPLFYQAQSIPKSFQQIGQSASGSQLNSIMIRAYLQQGHSIPKADPVFDFEGAISEGFAGIYRNVMKFDVASLYPSLMLEYQISPKEKDPNNYFIKLVQYFRDERLKNKELFQKTQDITYEHLEQSQKVFINSLYGALGAQGLCFNNIKQAALVTRHGRDVLKKTMDWVNNKGFTIANVDTDSVSFCLKDGADVTKEQINRLLDELNKLHPPNIVFTDDGFYPYFIVLRPKNYVMKDEKGKVKYKGSALKSPTLEPALREFIQEIVGSILNEKFNYVEIYHKYVKEILNIKDIKRWASRKTLTEKTLESERTNESKLRDALSSSTYTEGDRFYTFFKSDDSICLVENFDGDYNKEKLLEKLFKTSLRFETILDKNLFLNYKLKRNKQSLGELDGNQ